jgi:hypothetical protein
VFSVQVGNYSFEDYYRHSGFLSPYINLHRLEDNKVEQWSDKYIDYEKLKAVLKKAKAAANNVDDLKKKLPRELVDECRKEYAASKAVQMQLKQQQIGDKASSKQTNPINHFELTSRSSSPLPSLGEVNATDSTPLLFERRTSFGSNSDVSAGGGVPMKRQNSWSSLSHTVFKVTSYLGLANDKEVFYKSLENADEKFEQFIITYNEEVQKVKDFYQDKLHELSEHIEAIIESVDTSHIKQIPKKTKRASLIDGIVLKFEHAMHSRRASEFAIPSIRASVSGDSSDYDTMADAESPITKIRSQSSSDKLDLERESDSIKRALTDIYRNAKMLHNYSIMVSCRLE